MIFNDKYIRDFMIHLDREQKAERDTRRTSNELLDARLRRLEERLEALLYFLGTEVRPPNCPKEKRAGRWRYNYGPTGVRE